MKGTTFLTGRKNGLAGSEPSQNFQKRDVKNFGLSMVDIKTRDFTKVRRAVRLGRVTMGHTRLFKYCGTSIFNIEEE